MNMVNRMADIIGLSPIPDKIEFICNSVVDCDVYTRNKIEYVVNGRIIPAFLLIPKGEAIFPAVLVNHQHHSQRNWGKSEVCGLVGDPLQDFGSKLACEGFVVIAPDAICFEDRRVNAIGTQENHKEDDWNHFLSFCHGILTGETLAKISIEDAMGAISVLNGLDIVDKTKIGCLGHSYGGNTTYFATAFDKRINYAMSSGSVVSYKYRMDNSTGIEMSSIIPGFLKEFEIADVIKEIAPRDFLIVCSDEDKYSKDAPQIFEIAKQNYISKNAENNLQIKQFKGGHQLTQERFDYILEWITNHV
jgi:Dienelactone hydrolase and related enzymes